MNDAQWAFFEPFVTETGPLRGRPPSNHRRILEGIFWLARTKSPWRTLPEEFGKWRAVYGQFHRWSQAALWSVLLDALADAGRWPAMLQNSDAQMSGAHHYDADAKEERTKTLLAVRAMAPQQKLPPREHARAPYRNGVHPRRAGGCP
jgi:transposase